MTAAGSINCLKAAAGCFSPKAEAAKPDDYKYGSASSDTPFPEALETVSTSDATAKFSGQGAAIGKHKGRKAKKDEGDSKADSDKGTGKDELVPQPKAKAGSKRARTKADALAEHEAASASAGSKKRARTKADALAEHAAAEGDAKRARKSKGSKKGTVEQEPKLKLYS